MFTVLMWQQQQSTVWDMMTILLSFMLYERARSSSCCYCWIY